MMSETHGPDFRPGSLAVLAAQLKPRDGQMVAAGLASEGRTVFGVYTRECDIITVQAHGRKHRIDLAANPGAIVWAYPVRLVQKRFLT
jgi:hypothetical protein